MAKTHLSRTLDEAVANACDALPTRQSEDCLPKVPERACTDPPNFFKQGGVMRMFICAEETPFGLSTPQCNGVATAGH